MGQPQPILAFFTSWDQSIILLLPEEGGGEEEEVGVRGGCCSRTGRLIYVNVKEKKKLRPVFILWNISELLCIIYGNVLTSKITSSS